MGVPEITPVTGSKPKPEGREGLTEYETTGPHLKMDYYSQL